MDSVDAQSYKDRWESNDVNEKAMAVGYLILGVQAQVIFTADLLKKSVDAEILDDGSAEFLKKFSAKFMNRLIELGNRYWINKLDEYYKDEPN